MHLRMMLVLMGALIACGDKDDGDGDGETTDDTGEVVSGAAFEDYVYVTEAPVGDFTGFESGFQDAWLTQEVDPKKQITVSMTGTVEDFETGDEVDEARLRLWHNNDPSGTADQTTESNESGDVSGEWPVCTPVAYETSTDPVLDETKVTIQVNNVEGYSEDSTDVQFNSVSSATYKVIPSLLGVSPDPEKGIVAGTAYDIAGDAFFGAQIIVTNDDGVIPEGVVVKYFVEEFPNRQQEWTSEDGLFVIINVPVGTWNLEAYVSDGAGGHQLMGASQVSVIADSINISSIYTGYGDGIAYPESCLAAR